MKSVRIPGGLLLLLMGCSTHVLGSSRQDASSVPGELLVKVTEETAQAIERTGTGGGPPVIGIGSLDALCAKYEISAIERVFPVSQDPERIASRFPKRTKRIPPHAGDMPVLSRTYKLKFNPAWEAREVAVAFAADPHVEFAQPNYLATTDTKQEAVFP